MTVNWYPGHMVKARREVEENLKLVDVAVLLLDARAPFSCRNPDLEKMVRGKALILVLNKADLAQPEMSKNYVKKLRQEGFRVQTMDSLSGRGSREVLKEIRAAFQPVAERLQQKGRRIRAARVMVAGVPNVGKSSFLNSLVGKKMARTGAKPGVTRGKQWVRVREDIEFLDTPGLMWPRVDNEEQGLKLALLDVVGEKAYSELEVALYLVQILKEKHPEVLLDKLGLPTIAEDSEAILADISRRRGYLLKGGVPDGEKTCRHLILDFRRGSLGPISLDE